MWHVWVQMLFRNFLKNRISRKWCHKKHPRKRLMLSFLHALINAARRAKHTGNEKGISLKDELHAYWSTFVIFFVYKYVHFRCWARCIWTWQPVRTPWTMWSHWSFSCWWYWRASQCPTLYRYSEGPTSVTVSSYKTSKGFACMPSLSYAYCCVSN